MHDTLAQRDMSDAEREDAERVLETKGQDE
jgi:hypothetical protein